MLWVSAARLRSKNSPVFSDLKATTGEILCKYLFGYLQLNANFKANIYCSVRINFLCMIVRSSAWGCDRFGANVTEKANQV